MCMLPKESPPLGCMLLALISLLMVVPGDASAQGPPACGDDERSHVLDFWVGEWTVWSGGMQVGTNSIRKVQGGCAIEEHWVDSRGGTGQSLFYYLPSTGVWKQVWVTPYARVAGGVKEKVRVEGPQGGVRFQGTLARDDGPTYLDRTTLTPLEAGAVRQLIEVSNDEGETWQPTFDAEYRRAGPAN